MPYANRVETIRLPGFDGGLNTDADEFQLEPNESPDCMNVNFGLRGAVAKRKGYTRYDDASLTGTCRSINAWNQLGGNHNLVASNGTTIFYSNGATFSTQATSWDAPATLDDDFVGFAIYENVAYVSSKNGDTWKWDGTTWTAITDSTLDDSGSATPEFPRAAALETNYERMWAANIYDGGVQQASRVAYSNIGDAEKWAADDWIDVDPDDGYVITGLKVFGGNMMVFKEKGVYTIGGTASASFSLYNLDADIGCSSPRTIHSEGDRLIFFDQKTGVWQFDGSGFDRLDDKINLHLLEGISYNYAHKSTGFIWQGRYFLSVPWGSSTVNSRTFVYDLRNESWTQWDFGVADWTSRDEVVFGVGVRNLAGAYKMLTGLTDAGTAIAAYFETSWIAPENEAVKQRLHRADFAFSALGNHDVTVILKRDFSVDGTFTKTVNTDPGGGLWGTMVWGDVWGLGVDQVYTRITGWPKRWRVMQLRVEEAAATGQFQLNRILLHVSSLDRVRGAA